MLPLSLLVVYNLNPEKVFLRIVRPNDTNYQTLSNAEGCYINGNQNDYSDSVADAVADMGNDSRDTLNVISGNFKVLHCGFYC